ncbi:MAG: tRNA dihydrouridine(20/20a) synthase DusA [Hyphomicrobiales bacterium]
MNPTLATFAVAPMMDWTDRHCRAFHRVLTGEALLYTEMVTSAAVIHGDRARLLAHDPVTEGRVAVQLGGSDPAELAEAARIAEGFGYVAINLNCGCPSDRVQSGRFGACLMAEPETVARSVEAMRKAVRLPVTVKCRIGIDDQETELSLSRFVDTVAGAGCDTFIVHARKAWLKGLSPKENREVPPLDYGRVHLLKAARPDLSIHLNGGLGSLEEAQAHLPTLDGVMLGRAPYERPWLLARVDETFHGKPALVATREEAIDRFLPYIERELAKGTFLSRITRHMLGLYHGEPGGRLYRRILSEGAHQPGAGMPLLLKARDAVLRARENLARRAA